MTILATNAKARDKIPGPFAIGPAPPWPFAPSRALINEGVTDASGKVNKLVFETLGNEIVNTGTIELTNTGGLVFLADVHNAAGPSSTRRPPAPPRSSRARRPSAAPRRRPCPER